MLVKQIRCIMPTLGALKLKAMLADPPYGLPVFIGRDRLLDILDRYGMQSKLYKRKKRTSNSTHKLPVYSNLIKTIKLGFANQVWVSDITYLKLANNKYCYLFLVTDLYSRKVLGYALKPSLHAEGAIQALQMAISYACPKPGLIHHSDHGIQYCSKDYVSLLEQQGAILSMTGPQRCYDNAVAERINGILKHEFGLGSVLPNIKAASLLTANSIDVYNNIRPHLSLSLQTPSEVYEASLKAVA